MHCDPLPQTVLFSSQLSYDVVGYAANNGGGRTTKNHAQRGTAGSAKAAPAKTGSAVAKTGLAVAKTGSAVAMTGSAAASTWNVFSVLADGDAGEDNGWT